jgi:hypothetical protein
VLALLSLATALQYLTREVPLWPEQNRCFSCHNNGDAARALFTARRLGHSVPRTSIASTLGWLRDPAKWDSLPGDPQFSDKRLARIQFASALATARESGLLDDPEPLRRAVESLLPLQHADGYWPLDGGDTLGSPATYGIPLATAMALRTLRALPENVPRPAMERAARYLRALPLRTTLDAAAVLLGLGPDRPDAIDFLLRTQGSSGGWGPYPKAPPEAFDTAIAFLALAPLRRSDAAAPLRRAREYLLQNQQPDGSWTETTRPSGAQSYAQRVSTSGWAALALLSAE